MLLYIAAVIICINLTHIKSLFSLLCFIQFFYNIFIILISFSQHHLSFLLHHHGRVLRYSCFCRTHWALKLFSPTVQDHPSLPLSISDLSPVLQSSALALDHCSISLPRLLSVILWWLCGSEESMEVCSCWWSFLAAVSTGRETTWPWRYDLMIKINERRRDR